MKVVENQTPLLKTYQYKTLVLRGYRGHIDDPDLLLLLNREGADGWKVREEQQAGARDLKLMLEREVLVTVYPEDGYTASAPGTIEVIEQ